MSDEQISTSAKLNAERLMSGRRLTDDELCRIHSDGVIEIARRGIPQWK